MSWRIIISGAPLPVILVDSLPLATPKDRKALLIRMRFGTARKCHEQPYDNCK